MRARGLVVPLVVGLLAAGVGVAAPIVQPPEPESLVEGHTVFAVVEQVGGTNASEERYAAAVAVLVREVSYRASAFRFPGVLWFNDQYLVNKDDASGSRTTYRYPCNGAVIAVPAGAPNPQLDPNAFTQSNYVESYRIRDPNDVDWVVDKWSVNGVPAWTTPLQRDGTKYSLPDSGAGPECFVTDNPCAGPVLLPWNEEDQPAPYEDNGAAERRTMGCPPGVRVGQMTGHQATSGGYDYPCGGKDSAPKPRCAPLLIYNAVLFFFLDDLPAAGATKDHRDGSADRANDASGCDADSINMSMPAYNVWPCPAANDDREGNSHAYNPGRQYPVTTYAGRNNHGGSADCTGDALGDQGCHATRLVDIHYGVAALPVRAYAFTDAEGVTAPYHCHDAVATSDPATWCDQHDAFGAAGLESP